MKYPYKLLIVSLAMSASSLAIACMPHNTNDVFIARLKSVDSAAKSEPAAKHDLEFVHANFIFRSLKSWFIYSQPTQWQSDFKITTLHPNDLVIGLADNFDGDHPHRYRVASLAPLNCVNDTLSIGKPIAPFTAWNRKTASCRHDNPAAIGILDGFFDYDQSYYLAKLQRKYPTCAALERAYPALSHDLLSTAGITSTQGDNVQTAPQPPLFWARFKRWLSSVFA